MLDEPGDLTSSVVLTTINLAEHGQDSSLVINLAHLDWSSACTQRSLLFGLLLQYVDWFSSQPIVWLLENVSYLVYIVSCSLDVSL